MIFRLYHATSGGHVHCRLFAGKHDGALGKCGDLTMRIDEFAVFMEMHPNMQFREENILTSRYEREPAPKGMMR